MSSVKNMKPLKTKRSEQLETGRTGYIEAQVDFGDVVLAAANKFECPIRVDVNIHSPSDVYNYFKPERKMKIGKARIPMIQTVRSESDCTPTSGKPPDTQSNNDTPSVLKIDAIHNNKNRLVEISIDHYRAQEIPRILLKVFGVILPNYTKLTKFAIKNCLINKYTIPEIKNVLCLTAITDVSLDSLYLPEGNFDVLLQKGTLLQNLSLKRCHINDEVCQRLVTLLHYSQPAETKLQTLNLSSNQITDEGAKSIGEALRSNRHLRYLNLADNHGITDDGAKYILDTLKEFPLTDVEVLGKRQKYFKYLRNFESIYKRLLLDVENNSVHEGIKSMKKIVSASSLKSKGSGGKEKTSKSLLLEKNNTNVKVQLMALDLVGSFDHPFFNMHITVKEDAVYCKGNFVLCYLNLAYNGLMFPSVQKLLEVVEYQKIHRSDDLNGLVKVVVDGNNLPKDCEELESIGFLLKLGRSGSRSKQSIASSKGRM